MTTVRSLQLQWQDVNAHKTRINHMCKQQKAIKGLKVGGGQNAINTTSSTGVTGTPNVEDLRNVPSSGAPQNIIQHDIIVQNYPEEELAVCPKVISDEIIV